MITGIVRFWHLGRDEAKGTFEVEAKDEEEFNEKLYSEFSKYLISRNISFEDGKIYAGFHNVGDFEFIAQTIKEKENE